MGDTQVSQEAKDKLADILQADAKFTSWDYIYYERESAMAIVELIVESGWSPNE